MASGLRTILLSCLILLGMAVTLFSGFTVMVNFSPMNTTLFIIGILGMLVGFGLMAASSSMLHKV